MIKKILRKIYIKVLKAKGRINNSIGGFLLADIFINDYKKYTIRECRKAHKLGYSVDDCKLLNITKENKNKYLSTVDYYYMHPINGIYSSWIDDKLTYKYLCSGTPLDKYMPRYYFQINETGELLFLPDYNGEKNSWNSITNLLKEKKEFAIKLLAGSTGEGFYKAEYKDDKYYLNGKELSEDEFVNEIKKLRDYVITEYLHPHESFNRFCSKNINAVRYLCGKLNGEYMFLKSQIKIGTKLSGYVDNYGAGGVLCYIDENGNIGNGYILRDGKNIKIETHPDTGEKFSGKIPMWSEIKQAVKEFCDFFPQLSYLGFDFAVTSDNRVIIMEINSLTSLAAMQFDISLFETNAGCFYKEKLKK